jgi:hypothetical protein
MNIKLIITVDASNGGCLHADQIDEAGAEAAPTAVSASSVPERARS